MSTALISWSRGASFPDFSRNVCIALARSLPFLVWPTRRRRRLRASRRREGTDHECRDLQPQGANRLQHLPDAERGCRHSRAPS